MARKSRTQEQLLQLQPLSAEPKVAEASTAYKTAIYARLSANNFLNTNVDVLGSQINHLKEYVATHSDMELIDTYIDDGWSGINFNRPEFARMMDDMKSGKINCIVVRDFSRFGRNYLESGYYLQKIFPAYNVRFISVFDEFDSLVSDADSMIVSMMQLVNDFYCKDISRKICSAYDTKVPKGFCWGRVPYGYKRRNDDSGRLIMDEQTAHIVYLIFHWASQKKGMTQIAHNLDQLGFLYAPSDSNSKNTETAPPKTNWYSVTIKSITENPLYTGDYVYNRHRNRKYDASHIGHIPIEHWKFIPRTHPGYIVKSEYFMLQEYYSDKSNTFRHKSEEKARRNDNYNNPFYKILFCGECNHQMNAIRNSEKYTIEYHCKGHFLVQAAGHLSFSIKRTFLMEQVKKQLKSQKKEAINLLAALSSIPTTQAMECLESKKRNEISTLHEQHREIKEKLCRAENDHKKGLLDDETYNLQKEKLEMEETILCDDISFLHEQLSELSYCFSKENPWLCSLTALEIQDEIPSSTLHQLISRIEVYSDNRVVINYLLSDYKQKLIGYINEWEYIKHKEVSNNGE